MQSTSEKYTISLQKYTGYYVATLHFCNMKKLIMKEEQLKDIGLLILRVGLAVLKLPHGIAKAGIVRYSYVNPDYTQRANPDDIIDALKHIKTNL